MALLLCYGTCNVLVRFAFSFANILVCRVKTQDHNTISQFITHTYIHTITELHRNERRKVINNHMLKLLFSFHCIAFYTVSTCQLGMYIYRYIMYYVYMYYIGYNRGGGYHLYLSIASDPIYPIDKDDAKEDYDEKNDDGDGHGHSVATPASAGHGDVKHNNNKVHQLPGIGCRQYDLHCAWLPLPTLQRSCCCQPLLPSLHQSLG